MSLKDLKNHWKTIREELDQLPTNYIQEEPRVYGDWLNSDGIYRILKKYMSGEYGWIKGWEDGWEQWPIIWDSQPVESNTKCIPNTIELLKSIPCIKVAAFARMKANIKLNEHVDPVGPDYKFTYHLGLKCPKGCFLHHQVVGKVEEEDGKHIIFNATFPHWAENTSQEDRIILYIEYYN